MNSLLAADQAEVVVALGNARDGLGPLRNARVTSRVARIARELDLALAEELFISPGTAHAHIKRIYAKTGLHSRQEILDYMEKYTS